MARSSPRHGGADPHWWVPGAEHWSAPVPDMRLVSTGGRIGLGGWISRGVFRVVQFGVLGLGLEPVEGFIGGALVCGHEDALGLFNACPADECLAEMSFEFGGTSIDGMGCMSWSVVGCR